MARSKAGRVGASSLTNFLNFWTSVTVVTWPAVVVVLVRVRRAEFRRQHEALAQPVKAGFFHQPLGVFRIHHPDQLVADLELQIIIASDVAEELAQLHLSRFTLSICFRAGSDLSATMFTPAFG